MGLLDRFISGINRTYDPIDHIGDKVFIDPRFAQADRLAAEGRRDEGILTGIKQRYQDDTTSTVVRIAWGGPQRRAAGLLLGSGRRAGLRLGATVAIRTDDNDAVLDWARMCEAWGPQPDLAQRRTRFVPDEGVDDAAQDARVLSRLKKWTPQRGTVETFERRFALGMLTDNYDVAVRTANSGKARVSKNVIPWYAAWFVHPGSDVPLVVDPKDPARAEIDWPALARERSVAGGRWADRPPAGSVAEAVLSGSDVPPPTQAAAMTPDGPPAGTFEPAADGLAPIEGVDLQRYAFVERALIAARVPPAQHDAFAQQHGVPPGRWAAIDQAWNARAAQDWRVGAKIGEAREAAAKAAKRSR
jgi:hypothetical protein